MRWPIINISHIDKRKININFTKKVNICVNLNENTLISQTTSPTNFNKIITYNVSYVPDSTNPAVRKVTEDALLIGSNSSVYGQYLLLNDDTAYLNWKQNPKKELPYYINKSRTDNLTKYRIIKQEGKVITYEDPLELIRYPTFKYEETIEMHWHLTNDTATIMDLACQKASCDFGGRRWIAWFTQSIPISNGPHKFGDLPGLIIKLSDSKNIWKFEFTSLKSTNYNYPITKIEKNFNQLISTSKKDYFKKLRYVYDNYFDLIFKYQGNSSEKRETSVKWAKKEKQLNDWIELF